MFRNIQINEKVLLDICEIYGDTKVRVYADNNPIDICKIEKTGEFLGVGYRFNEFYLAIISKDASKEEKPIKLEAVYDMVNKKTVSITEENIILFEYMCIKKKKVEIAVVLQFLNSNNLQITVDEEINEFVNYVTAGNVFITKDNIKEYILNTYPELKKYTNLTAPISVVDYRKILRDLNMEFCEFHIIPQLI